MILCKLLVFFIPSSACLLGISQEQCQRWQWLWEEEKSEVPTVQHSIRHAEALSECLTGTGHAGPLIVQAAVLIQIDSFFYKYYIYGYCLAEILKLLQNLVWYCFTPVNETLFSYIRFNMNEIKISNLSHCFLKYGALVMWTGISGYLMVGRDTLCGGRRRCYLCVLLQHVIGWGNKKSNYISC